MLNYIIFFIFRWNYGQRYHPLKRKVSMCVLNRQGNLNSHDYTVHYLHCGIESANEWAGGSQHASRPDSFLWYSSRRVECSTYFLNKIYLDTLYQLQRTFSIVKLSDLANSTIENAIYSSILRKISEICFSLPDLTKTILFHKFIWYVRENSIC